VQVRIVPYAEMRRRLIPNGGDALVMDLSDGSSVADALKTLAIQINDQLIVGLDGEYATPDTPLHDGAELVLVTPMEGG
jgi:sulfur carrier protein ThiS